MSTQRSVLAASSLAPWAEIVAGADPTTVDALPTLPDDAWRYEAVEGVLVRVAGSGDLASTIAVALAALLFAFARPRRIGRIIGVAGVYRFSGAETGLLPDVGFYGAALFPLVVDRNKPLPFAPELAIEVASSGQSRTLFVWGNPLGLGCVARGAILGCLASRRLRALNYTLYRGCPGWGIRGSRIPAVAGRYLRGIASIRLPASFREAVLTHCASIRTMTR